MQRAVPAVDRTRRFAGSDLISCEWTNGTGLPLWLGWKRTDKNKLASRQCLDGQSLWLLAGLASRMAQAMEMHREQSLGRLPPFEAELRRRLWWHIVTLEQESAIIHGTKVETTWVDSDTKRPLNLSDSALSPYMREIPFEHEGPTEMLFCRIRFEVGECIRQVRKMERARRMSPSVPLAQVEQTVNEFEHRLDEHLLRRCDGSIPLHLLATSMGHSAICSMRLSIRQHPNVAGKTKGASKVSDLDTRQLFQLALKILEYDNMAYSTNSLQPFMWHVATNLPFQAIIYILKNLLHSVQGSEVDQAWAAIDQIYRNRPGLVEDAKPLNRTIGNLFLKAWDQTVGVADSQLLASEYPAASDAVIRLRARIQQAERVG